MTIATLVSQEVEQPAGPLTVAELVKRWQTEDGPRLTQFEQYRVRLAVRPLLELFGSLPASGFGPKKLMTVRAHFVTAGRGLATCNDRMATVRRCWKWGVANELVPADVWQALRAVSALKPRETTAPPPKVVMPARKADVDAVAMVSSRRTCDLIRLQRATAARSGELLRMQGSEIDRSETPWVYWPGRHKLTSLGMARRIPLGPVSREILQPRLEKFGDGTLFPGQRGGRPSSSQSWNMTVRRACEAAIRFGLITSRFHPHQLRHLAAYEIRRRHGRDAAQAILGHQSPETTDRYAGPAWEKALAAAEDLG